MSSVRSRLATAFTLGSIFFSALALVLMPMLVSAQTTQQTGLINYSGSSADQSGLINISGSGAPAAGSIITAANLQCVPAIATGSCGCGTRKDSNGNCTIPDKYQCPCGEKVNGFAITGICEADQQCHSTMAPGLTGGNSLTSLAQLGQVLGQLMGQLLQQQQNTSGSTATNPSATYTPPPTCSLTSTTDSSGSTSVTATLSWTSSNAESATISPSLGIVSPNGSQQVTVNAATVYTLTVAGSGGQNICSTTVLGPTGNNTGTCSALDQLAGTCTSTTTPPFNTSGDTLTVQPTSGTVPLVVNALFQSGLSCADAYDLSWGDASQDTTMAYNAPSSGSVCASTAQSNAFSHTYNAAGTYTVTLLSGTSLQFSTTATVTVSNPQSVVATTTPTATTTAPTATTTCSLTDQMLGNCSASSTPIAPTSVVSIIAGGAQTPGGNTSSAPGTTLSQYASYSSGASNTIKAPPLSGGPLGNIIYSGNGATLYAGNVNAASNTQTVGFFGSNTFGSAPQGLVSGWCETRPWASGFLSGILPASFFDNLCTWAGFQVGTPLTLRVQQTPPLPVAPAPAPAPSATTTPATTTPTVAPRAQIWASPASVPLGARTSIFWSAQGVTDCTETSADGSFSHNTLSGGANTVPITNPTTFTISCTDRNGDPVTSYTTVNLSI